MTTTFIDSARSASVSPRPRRIGMRMVSKYVRRRRAIVDDRRVGRIQSRAAFDLDRTAAVPVPGRCDVDCGSRLHTRKPGQAIDDVGDEVPARLGLRIRCVQERGPYQQDAVSVVTLGPVQEAVRAHGAQGRGNEERERRARSPPRPGRGGGAAGPVVDPRPPSFSAAATRGRDACSAGTTPKTTAAANASSAVNTKSRALMPIVVQPGTNRMMRGRHRDADRVYGRHRHRERNRDGDTREQRAFAEHLAHEAGAAGAERQADGKVAVPLRAASEQQIGDVRARDEEDEYR